MLNILRKQHDMSITGQGGKIILFMLPSLFAAIVLHVYFPRIAALPDGVRFLRPLGYVLLVPGLIFWGTAVIQLLRGFSAGQLITTGAYGIVRNPIYSSAIFFIFPAITLITLTWVYLLPSTFLYSGTMIYIGREEDQLRKAFGRKYEEYTARVGRIVPFRKP